MQGIYTLQAHMSNRDTYIHTYIHTYTIGWNFQSHNVRKYTVLNENFVFDVGEFFRNICMT